MFTQCVISLHIGHQKNVNGVGYNLDGANALIDVDTPISPYPTTSFTKDDTESKLLLFSGEFNTAGRRSCPCDDPYRQVPDLFYWPPHIEDDTEPGPLLSDELITGRETYYTGDYLCMGAADLH